jgi:hypothetical protein
MWTIQGEEEAEAQLSQMFNDFYECRALTSAEKTAFLADPAAAYRSEGMPVSIRQSGRTLAVNKTYYTENCLYVYGQPSDVPSNQFLNGKWLFIGYDRNGRIFANIENVTDAPDQFYFLNRNFVIYPWSNAGLQTSINASTVKPSTRTPGSTSPKTIDGVTMTRQQELGRVNDFVYWRFSNGGPRGIKGYLNAYNSTEAITWSGNNLYNYASVERFPTAYEPGLFNIYTYVSSNGAYYFSNHLIPQHKKAGRDANTKNLEIEILNVNPTSIDESQNTVVSFKVTNHGSITVVNPVVSVNLTGNVAIPYTNTNRTLAKGQSFNSSVTIPAGTVSANKSEIVYVHVNKSKTNPSGESTYTDNVDQENFGIQNIVTSSNFRITSHTPINPRSKENTTINWSFCNIGNTDISTPITINWPGGPPVSAGTANTLGEKWAYNSTTKTWNIVQNRTCDNGSVTMLTPDIAEISKTLNARGLTGNGLQAFRPVEIRNPNASVKFINKKQPTGEKELGDIEVLIANNMFKTINQGCTTTTGGCLPGGESQIFEVRFFDSVTGIEIPGSRFTQNFSMIHGEKKTYNLTASKTALMNYIGPNKTITEFKVRAYIPYYNGEYDVHGSPMYTDNKDEYIMQYIPPRPDVSNAKCDVLKHTNLGTFNLNGGPEIIKICMGHYPNNPSTLIEKGMQSYNYVLYRFLPMPVPQLDVYSPELNANNPNHFYQSLTVVDDSRVKGKDNTYLFRTNAGKEERGRYLPTSASMNFEIKTNRVSDADVTVALGSVNYTIPNGCYETNSLNLKYHYGCAEIMLFLPNSDANKFKIPVNYNQSDVDNRNISYPIANTKVPYLNPGNYKFELKATETYRYNYQTNDTFASGLYNWTEVK